MTTAGQGDNPRQYIIYVISYLKIQLFIIDVISSTLDKKLGFVAWELIHLKERSLRLQMFRQDVAEETHEEEAEATEGTKDVAGVSS